MSRLEQEIDEPPLIETRGLGVWYGRRRALRDVNLRLPPHRIFAIVGPSGCGKSTFLSTLNRLTDLVPDCRVAGSIRLGQLEVLDASTPLLSLRRRVGMVFQKPNPFPLSIRKNLTLPMWEHGFDRARIDGLVEATLRDVGLWEEVKERLDDRATTLSGGQQQRLCIARALALRPDVILFDEPCSALDPIASAVVEDLIVSLRDRVTVVIVTHNLAQARRIADHLAVFWQRDGAGTVLDRGPAQQLFEQPADPVVADYLHGSRG